MDSLLWSVIVFLVSLWLTIGSCRRIGPPRKRTDSRVQHRLTAVHRDDMPRADSRHRMVIPAAVKTDVTSLAEALPVGDDSGEPVLGIAKECRSACLPKLSGTSPVVRPHAA